MKYNFTFMALKISNDLGLKALYFKQLVTEMHIEAFSVRFALRLLDFFFT